MSISSDAILLKLLRIALGNEDNFSLPNAVNWREVISLSYEQGVAAIAVDGLEKLRETQPDIALGLDQPELENLKFEWYGQTMVCEMDYEGYKRTLVDLARLYENRNLRMMVLKGYGLSLDWPVPSHRQCGDIDIWLFDGGPAKAFVLSDREKPAWKRGDEAVEKLGIEVDREHHHHTVFLFEGRSVENHYDFINTKAHRDAAAIEKKLKELAVHTAEHDADGSMVFLPSASFNAVFLIRHLGQHFAAERMCLRQVLDWALFLAKHSGEVDWSEVMPFLKEIGIWNFCCVLNSICVDYLGFDSKSFPGLTENKKLEGKVLDDIFSPEFAEDEPSVGMFRVLSFKARRWWHNRWKHPLVYKEWWLPMLLTLAWSHIRKPDRDF